MSNESYDGRSLEWLIENLRKFRPAPISYVEQHKLADAAERGAKVTTDAPAPQEKTK